MPLNEKNVAEKAPLDILRDQIDVIDRDIASLLLKRIKLVGRVGRLKQEQKVSNSYIRPRREAVMVRELIKHFEGTGFPRAAVAAIWRTIIGASTTMESPLNLSVLCHGTDVSPHFLAREYFGSFIPCVIQHDVESVLHDISNNQHTIGVFPREVAKDAPACWWEKLAHYEGVNKPVVFAVLPFIRSRKDITPPPTALAVGRVDVLPTGDDETLFVLTTEKPARSEDWAIWYGKSLAALSLEQAGLKICNRGTNALFGVQGFHHNDHAKLAALLKEVNKSSADVQVEGVCIGSYASAYRHQ
jgi:chorismate mutase